MLLQCKQTYYTTASVVNVLLFPSGCPPNRCKNRLICFNRFPRPLLPPVFAPFPLSAATPLLTIGFFIKSVASELNDASMWYRKRSAKTELPASFNGIWRELDRVLLVFVLVFVLAIFEEWPRFEATTWAGDLWPVARRPLIGRNLITSSVAAQCREQLVSRQIEYFGVAESFVWKCEAGELAWSECRLIFRASFRVTVWLFGVTFDEYPSYSDSLDW